jgi:hypothetical protein
MAAGERVEEKRKKKLKTKRIKQGISVILVWKRMAPGEKEFKYMIFL